ncbi:MbtH family NRPS accessory protein [Streptomyces sp. SID12501]|nr:MbtH family NRPS accessory protein [Streptomyces sp. SID12501]
MSNSIDDPNGRFFVVVNAEGQHSLWPESVQVPDGWTVSHSAADCASCIHFINTNWTDMRPLSLVAHMARTASSEKESVR